MDLKSIKITAFGKWLMQQGQREAMFHLYTCLTTGAPDNLAWDLIEITNGDKNFPAKEIESVIKKAYEDLVNA